MGVVGCSCVENKMAGGGEVTGLSIGRIVYLDIDTTENDDRKSAEKAGRKSSDLRLWKIRYHMECSASMSF